MGIHPKSEIKCLFSHKFGAETREIGQRLQYLLRSFAIDLQIDPFPPGVAVDTRMQTLGVEAVVFLCSPESVRSPSVQMELAAAGRQGMPIFTIQQSGEVPAHLRKRSYWHLPSIDSPAFQSGAVELAQAIQTRVGLHRQIRLLHPDNFFHETIETAKAIANEFDRTLLAEYACELARRYRKLSDPTTRFWILLALGKANTSQAAKLVDKLPAPDHPLLLEGIRQAREMFRNDPPVA